MEGFDSKDKKRLRNISQAVQFIALLIVIQMIMRCGDSLSAIAM